MALKSLARPIENIGDPDEARVLAIVDHLSPLLDDWREGQDLRAAENQIDQELSSQRGAYDSVRREIDVIEGQIRIASQPIKVLQYGSIGAAAAGVLALIFLHGAAQLTGLALLAVAAAAGLFWNQARLKAKGLTKSKLEKEKTAADFAAAIEVLWRRKATVEEELRRRVGGFPEVELAEVRFPLKLAEIAGRQVLLDRSGAMPNVDLKVADVSALQTGVAHIAEKIQSLLTVPPMLSSAVASTSTDPFERLYGEESELSDLVLEFTYSLGQIGSTVIGVPLVSSDNVLVRRLSAGETAEAKAGAIDIPSDSEVEAQIKAFSDVVAASRERAAQVFEDLRDAYRLLSQGCALYADARARSINTLHANWLGVLQRATWCNRRFYCARTIMSPAYLGDLLGMPLDEAYRLSPEDLIVSLKNDASIAARLQAKPELETQLREVHLGVLEFIGQSEIGNATIVRPRHMEDQLRENIQAFRSVLQRVATGSSYPLLGFSSEAMLSFDPETEEWSSSVTPYTYHTHEVLRYGSVVRAYSDLMIPLWEHLWMEKADFRRSETFRTNEQLIRMSEKEAEKLIDIANQFRDDMRSVRENLNNLCAELKAKTTEVMNFRDGMESLGLLSERARGVIDKVGDASGEDEAEALARPDKLEMILAAQPQAQMESRGTVQDPIDIVRGVDALLFASGQPTRRLLTA